MFFRAGFELTGFDGIPVPGGRHLQQHDRDNELQIGRFKVNGLSPAQAEEFQTYQYLVTAKPAKADNDGLTSIVLVTFNQRRYSEACLCSIRRFTDEPYELIVVDNGSTDGTPDWLRSQSDITLICNDVNCGFPTAVNQGIEAARGDQLLLLNNDTLVTTGWLRRMRDALSRDPGIGLAGPCSNAVSGPQQIAVDYDELSQLDGFAWDRGRSLAGRTSDVERLVGFCLLVRREVIDQIGLFDERFGIGCFEDDDYCRRAIRAGFRCVIVWDSFVHHFGSVSFRASDLDFARVLTENQRKYEEKWRKETADCTGTLQLASPRPRLSLCMIVRDNAETIHPCLESIRPFVDEMIVVDTGSTDETPAICESFGAKVFHHPWTDDFSAARNHSLSHATGEWVFWMDSDDTIPPECGRKLRELAEREHRPRVLGYVMQVHCPGDSASGCREFTTVDHVKLFPNRADLRFEGRIHEQILPAIRRAGGDVEFTDVFVVHSGSDPSSEAKAKKVQRDLRILHKELDERGEHPFTLFNLGMTYADVNDFGRAVKFLERSLRVSAPTESHVRKLFALLVNSYAKSQRVADAERSCKRGLDLFPDDPELLFRCGMLHHAAGRMRKAVEAYETLLARQPQRHFSSIDTGLTGYKARHNLALVYEDQHNFEAAERQWRIITEEKPGYAAGWRGLGRTLLAAGELERAGTLAEQLQSHDGPRRAAGTLLSARLMEHRQEFVQARKLLKTACREQPEDVELKQELARLLFERFTAAEARSVLEALHSQQPEDASVLHNLGSAYLANGEPDRARDCWQRSLTLRPESPATRRLLQELRSNA